MEELKNIYYNLDNPASFSSVARLYRAAKEQNASITRRQVSEFLKTSEVYTLHKRNPLKFRRKKTFSPARHLDAQIDLIDMPNPVAKDNNGVRYIVIFIDIFTRYIHCQHVKTKSGAEVSKAMEQIVKRAGWSPQILWSDEGKEFTCKEFQKFCADHCIQHVVMRNNKETKCALVERGIRTIKERLYKIFTYRNSYKWLDCYQNVVSAYNNSLHRSIKTTPLEADKSGHTKEITEDEAQRKEPKLSVGDCVRLSKYRKQFSKGFHARNSEELFLISEVRRTIPPTYTIVDMSDEKVDGFFYEEEVVPFSDSGVYKVEKILDKRKHKGRIQYKVKWLHYPETMSSWVDGKELKSIS